MDLQLSDSVVVVTGGSSGIGRASALQLAAEGASVVVGARGREKLDALATEMNAVGGEHLTVPGDLMEDAGMAALVDAARERFGRIDALVAAVGSTPLGDFDELDDEIWDRAFRGKFLASVRAMRAVLPDMRRAGRGRIVVLAGNTAHAPSSWMATSGAMNAALVNLVNGVAQQVASDGIGVNCVSPGPTSTSRFEGMRAAVMRRQNVSEDAAAALIIGGIPAGRVADPEEIASLIAWLVSPRSSHLNGTNVVMDGAQTSVS